jgi:hypothetical protein
VKFNFGGWHENRRSKRRAKLGGTSEIKIETIVARILASAMVVA